MGMAETNEYSRMRRTGRPCPVRALGRISHPRRLHEATQTTGSRRGVCNMDIPGYPDSTIIAIGVVLLVCALQYLVPRTSILGAVLLTGYLGGAVATNVRVEQSPSTPSPPTPQLRLR
jgi:hypothetical protein